MTTLQNTTALNPVPSRVQHEAMILLREHVLADTPCFLWGAPGVGKSSMARAVSDDLGMTFIDIRLTLRESVDLRGIPQIIDGATRFFPPEEFPRKEGRYFILWDEMNAAPPATQVAAYQAIQERRIGDYVFPAGTRMVAAGNRMSDRAAAQRMPTPLANRFAHVDVEPDLEAWADWASVALQTPEFGSVAPQDIALLIGFLNYRKELFFKMPQDAREFASPRSWTRSAKYLGKPARLRSKLIANNVSQPNADELEAYARIVGELDSLETILANPSRARIPEPAQIAALYGVTIALGMHVEKKTVRAGAEYMMRLPREFRALFAATVLKRDASLAAYGLAPFIGSTGKGSV